MKRCLLAHRARRYHPSPHRRVLRSTPTRPHRCPWTPRRRRTRMATDSARELTAGDLAGLIGEIPQHIDDYKASKIEQWPVRSNRASELGHPCERFLTYNRVAWRHARLPDVGLQYVFDEGR